jgi:outer membrane biosynthesis protein TonB
MNANLDKIAQDLYGKIQTRFSDIQMGDENAEVLSKKEDIPKARFFEFEYKEGDEPLGTIAITLDETDGVVVQVSGDLVDDDNDNTTHHNAYKFIRSFRQFAKDRLLNFDIQNIGKSNLDKRDYQFQAKRKELPVMPQAPVMESKMYGNNRMSYQDLGENTRLVVKHTQLVNLDLPAGRTMHIESIYIENAQGERFKYPAKHLNGARALAEHIKHGGNPYDAIGQHICSLSEELAGLRKFKGYVSRQEQISEAMGSVTNRVIERIEEVKKEIHNLQKASYYEAFAESFEAQEEQMIPETIANDLINRLTIRTFNEDLKAVFPYIYKFVDESELPVLEVGIDDLLDEKAPPGAKAERMVKHIKTGYAKDGKLTDKEKSIAYATAWKQHNKKDESLDPTAAYESFMDDIVREDKDELFSPNSDARRVAIQKLNDLLAQNTEVGAYGDPAITALKGIIDNEEFVELLKDAPAETDLNDLIQGWIETNYPDLMGELEFPADQEAEQELPPAEPAPVAAEPAPAEPVAEPTAAVAPEAPVEPAPAPVAEGDNKDAWKKETPWMKVDTKKNPEGKVHNLAGQALKKSIAKAKEAGATLETQLDFGHGVKSIAEIIDECGLTPMECGFGDQQSPTDMILDSIKGFWNPTEKNFTIGGTKAKIKVLKGFQAGEYPGAKTKDIKDIIDYIDMKDPSAPVSRMKQLAGVPDRTVDEQQGPNIDANMQDLENKIRGMKLNFGGQEIALDNPEQIGNALKGVLGTTMQAAQQQAPNQNVQVPGGQINPQEFMRAILQKINGGQ